MLVNFYDGSTDLDRIRFDLSNGEVVVLDMGRVHFRSLARRLDENDEKDWIPIEVEDEDLVWHHYLVSATLVSDVQDMNRTVLKAVSAWQARGAICPFVTRVT